MAMTVTSTPKSFFAYALATQTDDCVLWPFAVDYKGYAILGRKQKPRRAGRAICEQTYGPAPSPMHDAAHRCGVSGCVNPRHLRWATRKENQADRIIHGTDARGEKFYAAKLNNEKVLAIRAESGTHQAIADRYGVTRESVTRILARKTWKHI
jgi:hypothetical protein